MSSGFPGGGRDFFTGAGGMNGSYTTNQQQQFPFRSPLSGILPDPASQIRRPDLIRKRSLAEFQQQSQQGLEFYLRNVKMRPNFHHANPLSTISPVDFPTVPSSLPYSRYGLPVLHRQRLQPLSIFNRNSGNVIFSAAAEVSGQDTEKKMMNHRLQELEKELLGDEDDGDGDGDGDEVSVVTHSEWSDTIQNLIGVNKAPISPSPTSSSSSCSSTSASPPNPSTKQSLIDAAAAISEGNPAAAGEIITRLQQLSSPRGSSEQRLTAFMVSALKSRLSTTDHPYSASELYSKEHKLSTQMLYEVSPCFKLSFMAANLAILNAASEQGFDKIHVVDFEIGEGGQYMHFLHALAGTKRAAALKITAFDDDNEKVKIVGERLSTLAEKIGVEFDFSVRKLIPAELSRENLGLKSDEALAVNLAFKLHSLPDESVTTENLRDELLRLVKGLSPAVATVVEQEMNGNTAPLAVRVRESCEHYGAVLESLEATVARGNPDRARIEEAVGRKIGNAVACEGRERVERCEVLGKWRARMGMAGFEAVAMGRPVADSLRGKLNSGTRGNPGFTVTEQAGGIGFGWMGRTITVASAWR
ncbi:scarecrow-like protein 8 [Salvia hispanica]|uniref:scarecrow-like protein 8 n=1 Tax=Salvia hispanica TaxID=49212 RepID=UPI00200930C6|nr:scarecrow-like protein 8 [Salvia hispanica]